MWLLVSEREIISSRAEVFLEHLVKISLKKKKSHQRVTATNEHIYKRTQKSFLDHLR